MEDFEIAVYDSELYYSGQLTKWLELRTKEYEFSPKDHGARYRYVEALIKNDKPKVALEFLAKFHKDDPENYDFNLQILNCLRKLNMEKNDFNWEVKPKSLSLNQELELLIIEKLKSKRKRKRNLNDIYLDLMMGDLLEFDEDGLLKYLKCSKYFKVEGDKFYDSIVERIE